MTVTATIEDKKTMKMSELFTFLCSNNGVTYPVNYVYNHNTTLF